MNIRCSMLIFYANSYNQEYWCNKHCRRVCMYFAGTIRLPMLRGVSANVNEWADAHTVTASKRTRGKEKSGSSYSRHNSIRSSIGSRQARCAKERAMMTTMTTTVAVTSTCMHFACVAGNECLCWYYCSSDVLILYSHYLQTIVNVLWARAHTQQPKKP